MRNDGTFHRNRRPWGRYRPEHAWLGSPGDGQPIRPRRSPWRWRFRSTQMRILLLALALGALAWWQLGSVAAEQAAR